MSVNTLILNTLHSTCSSGCGCALCIPNTINKLESPQLTIDDRIGVIETTIDGLHEIAVVDELLRSTTALEALWQSLEYNANIDAGIINVAVNALQSPYTLSTPLPSVECFYNDYNTSLSVSIESIGEMITKVWEAIRNFIASIYKKILEFFKNLFNINDKLKDRADSNTREIKVLQYDILNKKSNTESTIRTHISTIKLPSSQIKYLSIMTNKHYSITADLSNQVDRYRIFYNEGFNEYVKLQRITCEQALSNNQLLIKNAEEELARGSKRDDRIADTLISKARRRAGEQQVSYNVVIDKIRNRTTGSYLGGLFVNNTPNPKETTEIFDFRDVEIHAHDVELIPLIMLDELNTSSKALLIDHQSLIKGELAKVEELTKSITSAVESMVHTLKSDYTDYPALIRAFNSNLTELQSHYNKLLSRLYRVVKHTSELSATVLNNVVPDMLAAHANNEMS